LADVVFIEGLAVEAVVGVYDWEREVNQRLLIDLEMAWNCQRPAASDEVTQALDYAAVSERVSGCVQALRPKLLETLAEAVARLLQEQFGVSWLRLTIHKPGAIPAARSVGVRIERGAL